MKITSIANIVAIVGISGSSSLGFGVDVDTQVDAPDTFVNTPSAILSEGGIAGDDVHGIYRVNDFSQLAKVAEVSVWTTSVTHEPTIAHVTSDETLMVGDNGPDGLVGATGIRCGWTNMQGDRMGAWLPSMAPPFSIPLPEPSPKELVPTFDNTIILDLSSPDENSRVSVKRDRGVEHSMYKVKNGFFNVIVDNGMAIWKAVGDEKCTLAQHYAGGESNLLALHIKTGVIPEDRFFVKDDDEWRVIDWNGFFKKLSDMKRDYDQAAQQNLNME